MIGDAEALAAWKAKDGAEGGRIPMKEHEEKDMTSCGKQDPTCAAAGWKEYYQCNNCKLYFQAEPAPAPKKELELDSKPAKKFTLIGDAEALAAWKAEGGAGYIAPKEHKIEDLKDMTKYEQLEPTCDKAGHLEYYFCDLCMTYFYVQEGQPKPEPKPEPKKELQLDSKPGDKLVKIGDAAALTLWLAKDGAGYIEPLGHDMGEWEDSKDGKTHTRACLREGCDYTEKEEHVYKDGVCELCEAKEPKPAPAPKAPKTGDESNVALWAVLVLGLGSGATAVVLKKKHN